MRLFIKHDKDGNIISACKVTVMPKGVEQPYGPLKDGEFVLEIKLAANLIKLHCHEISDQYFINIQTKKLNKKR